jgi:DNA-binding transcriptional LysR family regulator
MVVPSVNQGFPLHLSNVNIVKIALSQENLPEYSAEMQDDLDWNDLRYVLVLSRTGRLGRAAQQLRVNETTVTRRIARIEKILGSQLFERVNRALLVTDVGQIVVQRAEQMEVDVEEIRNAATGADTKAAGSVRLTAIPMLLNRILVPALPALVEEHPQLQLQLVADARNLDLINRQADIALRLTRPDKGDRVIARRLGQFAYAVYGPTRPCRSPLPWITQGVPWSSLPHVRWMAEAIKREPQAGTPLIVNDSELAVHAVGAGLGRSLLPCCIGDRENNLSRLNDQEPVTRELWLLVHPDLKHLARTRAVIAWIEQVFGDLERSTRHPGKRRR